MEPAGSSPPSCSLREVSSCGRSRWQARTRRKRRRRCGATRCSCRCTTSCSCSSSSPDSPRCSSLRVCTDKTRIGRSCSSCSSTFRHGCLAALVPASGQLLGASSIIVKNVLGDWMHLATSDRSRTLATRVMVLVVAVLALWFWAEEQKTLVDLLLIGYNGIAQFLPGTVLAFGWRRTTGAGVGAGIVAGLIALAFLAAKGMPTVAGLNNGLVALAINTAVCVCVSLLTRAPLEAHLDEFADAAREPRPS